MHIVSTTSPMRPPRKGCLVLSRKEREEIVIGGDGGIVVTVVDIGGDSVRIGVTAARDIPVQRKELLQTAG